MAACPDTIRPPGTPNDIDGSDRDGQIAVVGGTQPLRQSFLTRPVADGRSAHQAGFAGWFGERDRSALCYRSRSPQEGATTGPSREAFNPSARGCERYPPRAILRKESAPRGGWISCRRDAHELHKLEVSTLSCIPHFPSHRFLSRLARQNESLSWGRSAVARGKAYERGIDCKSFGQCGYQEPSGESGFPTRSRKGGVDDQPDVAAV